METNETIRALETLTICASQISCNAQGRGPVSWETMQASLVFGRLALNGLSILRVSPGSSLCSPVTGLQVWDLPSVASLARNLVEAYLTLRYLVEPAESADEAMLRQTVWRYHEACERFKMLKTALPTSLKVDRLRLNAADLRRTIELSPEFQRLPKDLRKRILRGEISRLRTNQELCRNAGVSESYYEAMFKYGSNHTHSSPFCFAQMASFRVDDAEGQTVFRLSLKTSTGFMALGIRDFLRACLKTHHGLAKRASMRRIMAR